MIRSIGQFTFLIFSCLFFGIGSLHAASKNQSGQPATLDRPGDELTLNRIHLTAEAEKRLGIEIEPVEEQPVTRYRMYPGEMVLPAVSLIEAENQRAAAQSAIGAIALMNPSERVRIAEAQIDADGRVNAAEVRLKAARIALKRARQLVADKAGSQKGVDNARAEYDLAAADLETMKRRRDLLGPPLLVTRTRNKLWVRVQVFVNDLDGLDLAFPARLGRLGIQMDSTYRIARPISTAPSFASFDSSIVDIFYSVDNSDQRFRPNQRVGVEIPVLEKTNGLLVPASSILHDIYGNTWVYIRIGDLTYARQRVEVRSTVGGKAVLAAGLSVGDRVVSIGAAELFGTEFGVGK